jgi:hypothetical protein
VFNIILDAELSFQFSKYVELEFVAVLEGGGDPQGLELPVKWAKMT